MTSTALTSAASAVKSAVYSVLPGSSPKQDLDDEKIKITHKADSTGTGCETSYRRTIKVVRLDREKHPKASAWIRVVVTGTMNRLYQIKADDQDYIVLANGRLSKHEKVKRIKLEDGGRLPPFMITLSVDETATGYALSVLTPHYNLVQSARYGPYLERDVWHHGLSEVSFGFGSVRVFQAKVTEGSPKPTTATTLPLPPAPEPEPEPEQSSSWEYEPSPPVLSSPDLDRPGYLSPIYHSGKNGIIDYKYQLELQAEAARQPPRKKRKGNDGEEFEFESD